MTARPLLGTSWHVPRCAFDKVRWGIPPVGELAHCSCREEDEGSVILLYILHFISMQYSLHLWVQYVIFLLHKMWWICTIVRHMFTEYKVTGNNRPKQKTQVSAWVQNQDLGQQQHKALVKIQDLGQRRLTFFISCCWSSRRVLNSTVWTYDHGFKLPVVKYPVESVKHVLSWAEIRKPEFGCRCCFCRGMWRLIGRQWRWHPLWICWSWMQTAKFL